MLQPKWTTLQKYAVKTPGFIKWGKDIVYLDYHTRACIIFCINGMIRAGQLLEIRDATINDEEHYATTARPFGVFFTNRAMLRIMKQLHKGRIKL